MTRFSICTVLLFLLMAQACKHSLPGQNPSSGGGNSGGGGGSNTTPTNPCDPTKVYFQQQVLPILISNCTMSGCHDEAARRDGVVLTTYQNVMNTAEIRSGNPRESKLYKIITESDPRKRMPQPPASPLTSAQIGIIYKWIEQGAQNLSCQNACNTTTTVTYNLTIKPLLAQKCTGCHGGSAPQGGIDLSTYNGVKAKVTDGRLWGAINHLAGFSPMPKNGAKLSDCEITQVKKWIDAGALNN